jgi:hemolysin activation/secretion protein
VQEVLDKLVGSAPNRAELERQVVLAQDLPGVTLGTARFEREGDHGVLVVPVSRKRSNGRITVDNWGTRELGPVRVQLAYDFTGVTSYRDQLSLSAVLTPADPRELGFLWGRYSYQLDESGTEISGYAAYGRTRSGADLRQYDVRGTTQSAGIMLARPLLRGRKTSLWINAGLDYLALDQSLLGNLNHRDRVLMASLSLNGYWPLAGGRLRGGLGVSQGLDLLGATQAGDLMATRAQAHGVFTRFNGWASWNGNLLGPFSARLAAQAQTTTRPLLAMQQIMIGGPMFGRAYDFAERSGDMGLLGSAELQANLIDRNHGLMRSAQLYSYADGGTIANLRNAFAEGDRFSAGLGTRIGLAQAFQLNMEAAFPLNAPRYQSGDKAPRLSASLSKAF